MKVKKLKERWRVELSSYTAPYYIKIAYRKQVKQFCGNNYGNEWAGFDIARWCCPQWKQGVYVYFRNEIDVTHFLLSFVFNDLQV